MELFKFKMLCIMLLILSVYGMEIQDKDQNGVCKWTRWAKEMADGLVNSVYTTNVEDKFQKFQASLLKPLLDRIQCHRKNQIKKQKCLLETVDEEMNIQETAEKYKATIQKLFESPDYQQAVFPDPTEEEKNSDEIKPCLNCMDYFKLKYLSYYDHLGDARRNQHHYALCPECKRDNININGINAMKKCPYCNDENALHKECEAVQDLAIDTSGVIYDGSSFASMISLWSLSAISYLTFRRIKLDAYAELGEVAGGEFEKSGLFNLYEVARDGFFYYAMCATIFFGKNRHQNSLLINLKGLMQLALPIIAGLLTQFDYLDYSAGFMVFTIATLTADLIFRKWGSRKRVRTTSFNFSNFMAAYPHAYWWPINGETVKYLTKTSSFMQTLSMAENVAYYWILMGAIVAPIVKPSKSYVLYQQVANIGWNTGTAAAAARMGTTYTYMEVGPFGTYSTMVINALVAAGIFWYRMRSKMKQNVPVLNFNQIAQIMFSTFVVFHGSPELYKGLFYTNMIFLIGWMSFGCITACCNGN